MSLIDIRPEARTLMQALAGSSADRYFTEILGPALGRTAGIPLRTLDDAEALFLSPYGCLQAAFGHYAFLRRGKDRLELGEIALEALRRTCDPRDAGTLLEAPSGLLVWSRFEEVCTERRRRPMPELNVGVIAGLVELAQEIHRSAAGGSLAQWLADAIVRTGRVEPEFMRIVDIRGVGPKFASVFLRDAVHILDLEDSVENVDRLYLQPIDKWIRLVGEYLLNRTGEDRPADWVLAGKLAKYARHSGVSGVRFNMGATYLGAREARSSQDFDSMLRELAVGT